MSGAREKLKAERERQRSNHNGAGAGDLLTRCSDLSRARSPKWAWHERIVIGYLNLLLGNEGVGKGTMFAWMMARWSHGELAGDYEGTPINVGILGDEDSFDDVWTPRLHAAGADLGRMLQIERPDGDVVHIGEDRDKLVALVKAKEIKVLIYDQLLDNLDFDPTGGNQQKAIRDALRPARSLALELDIAVIGALHPNKRARTFRELIAGSVAFNAVSRSSLLLTEHPDDESRRVLVRGKGNLSQAPPSFEFDLGSYVFEANGDLFSVPQVRDVTEGILSVDELVGVDPPKVDHSKIGKACSIIEDGLPRDGQWHPSRPLIEACEKEKINERTAKRARVKLGLEYQRTETMPASVNWRWPTEGSSEDKGA
jgi:hypothetical protein